MILSQKNSELWPRNLICYLFLNYQSMHFGLVQMLFADKLVSYPMLNWIIRWKSVTRQIASPPYFHSYILQLVIGELSILIHGFEFLGCRLHRISQSIMLNANPWDQFYIFLSCAFPCVQITVLYKNLWLLFLTWSVFDI